MVYYLDLVKVYLKLYRVCFEIFIMFGFNFDVLVVKGFELWINIWGIVEDNDIFNLCMYLYIGCFDWL